MVSEVAQDLVISIDPADGMSVGSVYGVPGELLAEAGSGTVTITIGSAFLSSNGGGIYATLEGDASAREALADISVAYTDAVSQKRENDSAAVFGRAGDAPVNLAKAELLVDQFLTMDSALAAYHEKRNPRQSLAMLEGLSDRIAGSGLDGMDGEMELVDGLKTKASRLAGLGGRTLPWEVFGEWKVTRHRGVDDISRGDLVEISDDGEFITERTRGRDKGEEIYQEFAINERELHIEYTDLVFRYRVRGDRLILANTADGTQIVLERYDG